MYGPHGYSSTQKHMKEEATRKKKPDDNDSNNTNKLMNNTFSAADQKKQFKYKIIRSSLIMIEQSQKLRQFVIL